MLMESSDAGDPESFRETELFKKCQEIGIIPGSEAELAEKTEELSTTPAGAPKTEYQHHTHPEDTLSLTLNVDQMWCPACAWVIEEALRKTPGIKDASCNFATDRVRCDYNPVLVSPQRIIDSIKGLGYEASPPDEASLEKERRTEFIRFVISALLTMNAMMFSFSLYSGFFSAPSPESIHKLSWPIFLMASIVLFYGGRNIYRRAWAGVFTAAFSMETLITLGSFSAYFISIYGLLTRSIHLYFDTACVLITLVLLGKMLERRAKDEIQGDLANFFSLRPSKVKICSERYPHGRYVSAERLRKGDTFRVEEREVLPADGVILKGEGRVDESSLTGEPRPLAKKPGDRVKSGSKIIQGKFNVEAEAVGEHSIVGQMITIMEKALGKRTPFEGKTERALQWFVPVILTLAFGTGLVCLFSGLSLDQSIIRSVTVMVIACPCTLGIAIPMARVAGISLAGRKGILVRDFRSFEQAEKMSCFVLDKTGTVTKGEWSLLEIIPVASLSRIEALRLAASMERESDHLIAAEIIREAAKNQAEPLKIEAIEIFDNGISGLFSEHRVKIGSRGFLTAELENSSAIPIPKDEPTQSLVFMSYGAQICAIFVFGDEIKETSIPTVQRMRSAGYQIAVVSGDEARTTKAIANELGIDDAHGGKLPKEKAAFIAKLQRKGHQVAMVGDGINDAPAMIQADLAIAVYSGNQLSEEAADLTLMRGDPLQICDFMELAKRVKKKIHQNLGCSFIYNLIGIPIAMSGLLSPLVAVSAMLLSSLSVIGNTLLLLKRAQPS